MRQILLILLFLISIKGYTQKVTIKGTAFDTTNGRHWVHIVVNDTLRKFREGKTQNLNNFKKLTEDTTLNLFAKSDGIFQITANSTDSIFFQSVRHIPKVYSVSDLLKMKSVNIRLDPEVCIPYVPCEDTIPSQVYIFVGQKLKIDFEPEPYYCDAIMLNFKLNAEYKILEQEVGHYSKDTIRFAFFNHQGIPSFLKFENVLLFVSEYCGKLYHERFQYFDLYKTADGKWASPGDPYKYDIYHKKEIKARNIQFADTVWFDISKLSEAAIKEQYPEPYYKITEQKAIPVMGTYIEELIEVKINGVLKSKKIKPD